MFHKVRNIVRAQGVSGLARRSVAYAYRRGIRPWIPSKPLHYAGIPISYDRKWGAGGIANYLDVCRKAAIHSETFATFRSSPSFTTILEHVSEDQGREYLGHLSPHGRALTGIAEAAKNDTVGGPALMHLDSGLVISPTTLRYLKVADDLELLFGGLDGADVLEIGIGYGGQCRILDSLFKIRSYTLVDLKPVLGLADEFLSHFPLRCTVRFATMNELEARDYGFLLSNYAFTELSREVQDAYFSKVLLNTHRGYITYNEISPPDFQSMTREELCQRLRAHVVEEKPLTHPRNCIIVWGTSPDREFGSA
jgi:hypothetical protein